MMAITGGALDASSECKGGLAGDEVDDDSSQ